MYDIFNEVRDIISKDNILAIERFLNFKQPSIKIKKIRVEKAKLIH